MFGKRSKVKTSDLKDSILTDAQEATLLTNNVLGIRTELSSSSLRKSMMLSLPLTRKQLLISTHSRAEKPIQHNVENKFNRRLRESRKS